MQHAQPSTIRIYCRHALHSSIATNYCDIKLLICLASHNYIRECVGAVVQNDAVNVRSHQRCALSLSKDAIRNKIVYFTHFN